jgi:hypothetical protein
MASGHLLELAIRQSGAILQALARHRTALWRAAEISADGSHKVARSATDVAGRCRPRSREQRVTWREFHAHINAGITKGHEISQRRRARSGVPAARQSAPRSDVRVAQLAAMARAHEEQIKFWRALAMECCRCRPGSASDVRSLVGTAVGRRASLNGCRLGRRTLNVLPSPNYCAPGQAWAGRMRCNKL